RLEPQPLREVAIGMLEDSAQSARARDVAYGFRTAGGPERAAQLCEEVAASGREPARGPGRIAAAAADGRAPRRAGQSGEHIAISEITVVSSEMPPSSAPSSAGSIRGARPES